GTRLEQAVTLTVSGSAPAAASGDSGVVLKLGGVLGTAPAVGLGLDPDEIEASLAAAETLAAVVAQQLVCHYDPRRGHDQETLRRAAALAAERGAAPWLEAVVTSIEGVEQEIAELGRTVAAVGSPFKVVLLSPAPDLKCTLPGSEWPPAPS